MANHGAVFVGKDLNEAYDKAMWAEMACKKAYIALLTQKMRGKIG